MLSAFGYRTYMRSLQRGPDFRPGYRASAVIGLEHDSLESSLPEPQADQPRVAENRSGTMPRFAGVNLNV
jgi:hypothetical protein